MPNLLNRKAIHLADDDDTTFAMAWTFFWARTLYAYIMFAHWAKMLCLFHTFPFRYPLLYVTLPYLML